MIALNSSQLLAVPTGVFQRRTFCCIKERHKRDNVIANGVKYSAVDCLIMNKSIPVQAWKGLEVYAMLRVPDLKKNRHIKVVSLLVPVAFIP